MVMDGDEGESRPARGKKARTELKIMSKPLCAAKTPPSVSMMTGVQEIQITPSPVPLENCIENAGFVDTNPFQCSMRPIHNGEERKPFDLQHGTNVFGRHPAFGIADERISRKFASITVDPHTRCVTLVPNGKNPAKLVRRVGNDVESRRLVIGQPELCKDGDELWLLRGEWRFIFIITNDQVMEEVDGMLSATQNSTLLVEDMTPSPPTQRTRARGVKRIAADTVAEPYAKRLRSHGFGEDDVIIAHSELDIIKVIGSGACGEVTLAMWKGVKVACKKIFRALLHSDVVEEFRAEYSLLRKLRHPHIVLFMGMYEHEGQVGIVTEFVARGALSDVLQSRQTLSLSTIVRMASDTARGMNYLHLFNPPIIHRDLKSSNLLVDAAFTIKVTDFGLARYTKKNEKAKTFCGTVPWTAPEVLAGGTDYTGKCDVYSYAVVLWELAHRVEPYEELSAPQIIIGVTREELRPAISDECPPALAQLMEVCWRTSPNDRPTFAEIVALMTRMEAEAIDYERQTQKTPPSGREGARDLNERFHSQEAIDDAPEDDDAMDAKTLTSSKMAPKEADRSKWEWEVAADDVTFTKEIGRGASAVVYQGRYRGQDVAVKVLTAELNEEFQKELDVMASVRSPHVVFFYGAVLRPQTALVMELFRKGSLYDLMNSRRTNFSEWETVLKLAKSAVQAVGTLHTWKPSIVHRDVKSQNLLVDEHLNVKVGDFGLARFAVADNHRTLVQLRGTYAYAAPEVYHGNEYTCASDVYSLGIVLWELVYRCLNGEYMRPYGEHPRFRFDYQIIIQTAKHGLRPTVSPLTPPPLSELMCEAWHEDASKRPTCENMANRLQTLIDLYVKEQRRQATKSMAATKRTKKRKK